MKRIIEFITDEARQQLESAAQTDARTNPNELNQRVQRVFDDHPSLGEGVASLVQALYGFKPKVNAAGTNRFFGPKMLEMFKNRQSGEKFLVIDDHKTAGTYAYGIGNHGAYAYYDSNVCEALRGDEASSFLELIEEEWTDEYLLTTLSKMGWQYTDNFLRFVGGNLD